VPLGGYVGSHRSFGFFSGCAAEELIICPLIISVWLMASGLASWSQRAKEVVATGSLFLKIHFPDELPVSRCREEIGATIAKHPVVIVCGDTGSGKTTQLPKIVLALGRGGDGKRIGCTQPRRIAATSVARRVATEMEVELGREVGCQVRFDDRTDREVTRIKFMTDGILLAETRRDPDLLEYDTLIIDEAHERSLNIDFILGYLHRLLERRTDLKVVLSSATLDAGSFAKFFGGAPVVSVEGRTYPVEDIFQIAEHDREPLVEQVGRALNELSSLDPLGDTLVFLPGEREIRDCADWLGGKKFFRTLVLPLYARQAGAEQEAIFRPIAGQRRIILATNVAETSLTIPDIRFVVDSGLARVSRHDPVSDIQRLQIEPISQASARQRRGRCGRVGPGVCVRLYAEEDFASRPEFTTPEILRSNLAGVVLQMEHLGLGDPLLFPFVDPPQPKRIAQAYRVLEEIGAIHKKGKHIALTKVGETLARLPLDPRIGRILVGARDEGCLAEGLVIAAALTVPDPRERPQDKQQAADEAHARFRDARSDFTGWLKLWHGITEVSASSGNQLRRFCERSFLNHRRVREWGQLHRELRQTLRELRWALPDAKAAFSDPADTYHEPLHRAILAAIPSHIGMNLGKKLGYQGEGGRAFFVFPGSGVFASSPAWVMAFEKVETAKLYARNVAMFDPGWMEKVAPHLCRYRYNNPHWVAEQGAVYGEERVLAFGLPVVEKRRIHYGRVDLVVARRVFLLEALVLGNTKSPLLALAHNRATLIEAEKLEHKVRRRGGLLHPTAVEDWYGEKLPATICTQKEFEQWVASAPPGILDFTLEDCLSEIPGGLVLEDYPNTVASPEGEVEFALSYLHMPGDSADGICIEIPLIELPALPAWYGDWLVPGWLGEKTGVLLRCLHKDLRTLLPSNREVADDFVADWAGYVPEVSLIEALIDTLRETYGVSVSEESFSLDRMPEHLRMRFVVVDDQGRVIGESRDLTDLQERLAGKLRDRFAKVAKGRFDRSGLTSWSFGDLPEEYALDHRTPGFPRLYDAGNRGVGLRLWPTRAAGDCQHRRGVAALFEKVSVGTTRRLTELLEGGNPRPKTPANTLPRPTAAPSLEGFASLAAAFGGSAVPAKQSSGASGKKVVPNQGAATWTRENLWLLDQLGASPGRALMDLRRRLLGDQLGCPLTKSAWDEAVEGTEIAIWDQVGIALDQLRRILGVAENVGSLLGRKDPGFEESLADAREQFQSLFAPGWLLTDDFTRSLIDIQGLEMRLTRMFGSAPGKDAAKLAEYRKAINRDQNGAALSACQGHCEACPVGLSQGDRRCI